MGTVADWKLTSGHAGCRQLQQCLPAHWRAVILARGGAKQWLLTRKRREKTVIFRALMVATAVAASATSVVATEIWLSPVGSVGVGSSPPTNADDIPTIIHNVNQSAGTLFLWGRPASGKTLANWSFRIASTAPDVISLSQTAIEPFNPVLGATDPPLIRDLVRWEFVNEPSARVDATTGDTVLSGELQGFSISQTLRMGVGIGPDSTGISLTDPFYDADNDAWLMGQVDYTIHELVGNAELFVQIGAEGINNLGALPGQLEDSANVDVILGAQSDSALNGSTDRLINSATAEAVLTVLTALQADFDSDGDADGSDFLRWQRGFDTGTLREEGDANGDGVVDAEDFAIWQVDFSATATSSGMLPTPVPEPPAATVGMLIIAMLACWRPGVAPTSPGRNDRRGCQR